MNTFLEEHGPPIKNTEQDPARPASVRGSFRDAPVFVYDLMIVGYPAHPPVPKVVRDLNNMIHYDDCGLQDFRTDEEVSDCARKTHAWCMSAH
jgi:hypothetical protein